MLAATFAAMEWLRGVALTGFPWNAIGYALMPTPLMMQSVSVLGMTGMNALAVFVFAMPALLAFDRHVRLGLTLALVLVAAHLGFGYLRLAGAGTGAGADARTLRVRLVQPSIKQGLKWARDERGAVFKTYGEMSARPFRPAGAAKADGKPQKPQLIIWPETAVPFLFNQHPEALASIGQMLDPGQVLLTGAVRMEGDSISDPDTRFYNSVVAINDQGVIYDADDKVHLVPLGEFVPFPKLLARLGITKLVDLPGGFTPGADRHPIEVAPDVRVIPYVCYEIIFPGIADRQAANADFIVNVTNDAWFGDTPGPYQHFRQAQVRAVEAGRPLLRAANDGISGVVDPYGRVVDAFALNAVGDLDVVVPITRAATGWFGPRGLVGWIFVAMLALGGIILAFGSRLRAN